MKQTIIMILLLAVGFGLYAQPEQLTVFNFAGLRPHGSEQDRMDTIRQLTAKGIEVYHFNPEYIIAGANLPQLRFFPATSYRRISALPAPGNIWLVTPIDTADRDILRSLGNVLFDLGREVLLQSDLGQAELRTRLRGSFVMLEMQAMRIPAQRQELSPRQQVQRDVIDLVNAVNPDSVLWFMQSLQNFQTRYALAPNRLQVATWIRDQFIRMGVTDVALHPFQWNNTTQYNVVATIPGTHYPDQYIIVGGHHDSISSGSPMTWAPGADDNASGSTAALEMARVMMSQDYQPECSIRFMTFAAEEFGLWGSKNYAQYAQNMGMDIKLMINHDMISHSTQLPTNWNVVLIPYAGSEAQNTLTHQMTQQYTVLNTLNGPLNASSSDSHPFWQRGFPAIWFFEAEFSPHYHSPQDIVANINPHYCAEVIRASLATTARLAGLPYVPQNVTVTDAGNGTSLLVQWDEPNDPFVVEYNVYSRSVGGSFGDPVTVNGTQYMLTGLTNGQAYEVGVSSVSVDDFESFLTLSAGTPGVIPRTPMNFVDEPGFGQVRITWDANPELDVVGYKLYRSLEQGVVGAWVNNAIVTATEFIETDIHDFNYRYWTIQAVDADGNSSPYHPQIRSRQMSLNQGILIVNETRNGSGINPFQPTNAQIDAFYQTLMEGFYISHYNTQTEPQLKLCDLGIYSSILWHGNDFIDYNYPYLVRGELRKYIQAGGNVFITSFYPNRAFANDIGSPVYPEGSYMPTVLGIGTTHFSNNARFRYARPQGSGFPPLEVDPEKTISALHNHIYNIESIGAAGTAQNIYFYGSDYANDSNQGIMNGMPVGVYHQTGAAKVITVSFPLYNMTMSSAQNLITYVFNGLFGETSSGGEGASPPVRISISANIPNPFQDKTAFSIALPQTGTNINVSIYNLKGQLVRTLHSGTLNSKRITLAWDGRDDKALTTASGVYLIKVSSGGHSATRKILRIK